MSGNVVESTALGATCLAGIAVGLWIKEDIFGQRRIDRLFASAMEETRKEKLYARWQEAVKRSMNRLEAE